MRILSQDVVSISMIHPLRPTAAGCSFRTPEPSELSQWLLAVLPADSKLSWKKLRKIYGKGTRIATEEERGRFRWFPCFVQAKVLLFFSLGCLCYVWINWYVFLVFCCLCFCSVQTCWFGFPFFPYFSPCKDIFLSPLVFLFPLFRAPVGGDGHHWLFAGCGSTHLLLPQGGPGAGRRHAAGSHLAVKTSRLS